MTESNKVKLPRIQCRGEEGKQDDLEGQTEERFMRVMSRFEKSRQESKTMLL